MRANFTLFFLAVFLVAAWVGRVWTDIAKIMPVCVAAIPGLLLVLVQLYRDATQWDRRQSEGSGGIEMDEVYDVKLDKKVELWRTITFFAWFIGGALGIWLLGIVVSLPILIFLYALVEGREKWTTSLIMTACTYGLLSVLFEYMLETRWPAGILFG